MQWFALEMQHNAQNALYCTIDAHYATQVRNKMHEILAHIYNEIKCLTGIKKCKALHHIDSKLENIKLRTLQYYRYILD